MAISLKSRGLGLETAPERHARILIVEDEATTANLIRHWLEVEGYSCQTALNGVEALERLKQSPFDLMISDITMPKLTGVELLPLARDLVPDLAVLIMTGTEDRSLAIRILKREPSAISTSPSTKTKF